MTRPARAISAITRFLPKYIYSLVVSLFLFTLGIFSRRNRFLIFQIARHFGWKQGTEEERIPILPLAAVLDCHLNLTLLEPLGEGGNVTLLELMVISSLARGARPPVAFEIGTFDGRTTLNLAANLPADGHVFTLDLPRSDLRETKFDLAPGESAFVAKDASGLKFTGTDLAPRITQLYGDSATFNFRSYAGRMGLVFVDGSHAFEYVQQDTTTALNLAAGSGVILWHDYQQDWRDVIRALNEFAATDPRCANLRRIEGTSLVMLRRENTRRPA